MQHHAAWLGFNRHRGPRDQRRGWVVFGFPGVGADYTPVTAEAHEALLAHLDDHRREIYVAMFAELAACLAP